MASRGDWSGGGGSVETTGANPWFLANTQEIRYCVEMDPQYFGDLPTAAETQIDLAFEYWRRNFAATVTPKSQVNLEMATQKVLRQPACNSQTDIVFYLGVLPPHIGDYVSDLPQYVGLAIRTEYDRVNMRGRGFVYISSDGGPLSYRGPGMRQGAWHFGKGGLLFKVLVHELGHVYGLPHIFENIVMRDDFPELAIRSPFDSSVSLPWPTFEGATLEGTIAEICTGLPNPSLLEFFEIPQQYRGGVCVRFDYDIKTGQGVVYVGAGRPLVNVLGTIVAQKTNAEPLGGIKIYIPEEQIAFPGVRPDITVSGVQAMRRTISARFTSSLNGNQKQILFTLSPTNWAGSGAIIGGVVNGQIIFDLFH